MKRGIENNEEIGLIDKKSRKEKSVPSRIFYSILIEKVKNLDNQIEELEKKRIALTSCYTCARCNTNFLPLLDVNSHLSTTHFLRSCKPINDEYTPCETMQCYSCFNSNIYGYQPPDEEVSIVVSTCPGCSYLQYVNSLSETSSFNKLRTEETLDTTNEM